MTDSGNAGKTVRTREVAGMNRAARECGDKTRAGEDRGHERGSLHGGGGRWGC